MYVISLFALLSLTAQYDIAGIFLILQLSAINLLSACLIHTVRVKSNLAALHWLYHSLVLATDNNPIRSLEISFSVNLLV